MQNSVQAVNTCVRFVTPADAVAVAAAGLN